MIIYHVYTYAGDALLTPYVVCSIVRANRLAGLEQGKDYKIIVLDEAAQQCPDETIKSCCNLGAEWRITSYWRGGNLRGDACIRGMMQDMHHSPEWGEDCISVKIDSDVIVRNVDWILKFRDTHNKHLAGADDRGNVYGMIYAISQQAIHAVRDSLDSCPVGPWAPEDQVVGHRVRLLFGDESFMPVSLRVPGYLPGSINGPQGDIAPCLWGQGVRPDMYSDTAAVNLRATVTQPTDEALISVAKDLIPIC